MKMQHCIVERNITDADYDVFIKCATLALAELDDNEPNCCCECLNQNLVHIRIQKNCFHCAHSLYVVDCRTAYLRPE